MTFYKFNGAIHKINFVWSGKEAVRRDKEVKKVKNEIKSFLKPIFFWRNFSFHELFHNKVSYDVSSTRNISNVNFFCEFLSFREILNSF